MSKVIIVKTAAGALGLDPTTFKWKSWGAPRFYVLWAEALTALYHYSPSHGRRGYYLAEIVADKLGGKASLPVVPEAPPGGVY